MSSNSLKFKIEGMTCAACSGVIEKETALLKGVEKAEVNFATESAEFKVGDGFDLETFHALLKNWDTGPLTPTLKQKVHQRLSSTAIFTMQ